MYYTVRLGWNPTVFTEFVALGDKTECPLSFCVVYAFPERFHSLFSAGGERDQNSIWAVNFLNSLSALSHWLAQTLRLNRGSAHLAIKCLDCLWNSALQSVNSRSVNPTTLKTRKGSPACVQMLVQAMSIYNNNSSKTMDGSNHKVEANVLLLGAENVGKSGKHIAIGLLWKPIAYVFYSYFSIPTSGSGHQNVVRY